MFLQAHGFEVIASGRDPARCQALEGAGMEVLQHDWAQPLPRQKQSALRDVDIIVHCAALSAPFGRLANFTLANEVATTNIVDFACKAQVTRFVNISTPSVYFRFEDQLGLSESTPLPPPVNHYAATKHRAEQIALSLPEIGPINLRPRGIYGAGDRALLPRILRAASKGPLPLLRRGRAKIDLTHVDDLLEAILAAIEAGKQREGETYNISGGEVLPVTEIVEKSCARAGVPVRWRPLPMALVFPVVGGIENIAKLLPNQPEPTVTRYGLGLFAYEQSLDISKAQQHLGWKPQIPFSEGLERVFQEKTGP